MLATRAAEGSKSDDDRQCAALAAHEDAEESAIATAEPLPISFEALYHEQFAFVWRSTRRLGVSPSALDDVVQEIFLVVHKKLASFEGRSSLKTWLFGIVRRVVADHRRSKRRKPTSPMPADDFESVRDPNASAPHRSFEVVDLVDCLLESLDEDKREVFILAELEQMTLAEIAVATNTNPNTVASRLRAARRYFEEAFERHEQEVP
jgi:RNA polymerase sigma-70 factor, ECF subfamily